MQATANVDCNTSAPSSCTISPKQSVASHAYYVVSVLSFKMGFRNNSNIDITQ